jgi:methyl-accepting chemotaxis protein
MARRPKQPPAIVRLVASATEEMASSVNEIGRQAQAGIAMQAVGQAQEANNPVRELVKAPARIGDVVFNMIAGQTNLLALNASMVAARSR